MAEFFDLTVARALGEQRTKATVETVHRRLQLGLRQSIGIQKDPPPACMDASLAYIDPSSVVRSIHGDLASMLIGGLASLLLQTLHPLAMAGVAQHSRYEEEPLGRLERTALFVGVTTYGSTDEANRAIKQIRSIHNRVVGQASDGRPYSANDPELLTWVHSSEVLCFLEASMLYGPRPLSRADQDAYLRDMAKVAYDLGAKTVPESRAELDNYFEKTRPELALTSEAKTARDFVVRGVSRKPYERASYATLIAAAQGVLPSWAQRQLGFVTLPVADRFAVRPAALALCYAMRWITTPMDYVVSVNPPSTVIT